MRAAALALLLVLSGCSFRAGHERPLIPQERTGEHPSTRTSCEFKGITWSILIPDAPLCVQGSEVR